LHNIKNYLNKIIINLNLIITMKKLILLTTSLLLLSILQTNAQCWVDKVKGYDYETVGKLRPNSSTDDCSTKEAIAAAALLLLFD